MFKLSHPTESNSFLARAVTLLAGSALVAGVGLLAGCPSNSNEQQSSAPSPVAQAAVFGGVINGGRQPVVNATVVAYASATTPGALPVRIGATTTDANGRFTIATFSPAPVTGQMIYVIAKGGDATGAGTNSALKLMTVAGIQGDTLAPVPETVNINELSTVAATAALQGFLQFVDCAQIGGTAGKQCVAVANNSGMLNMAATVRNLVNVVNGTPSAFLTAQAALQDGAPFEKTLEKQNTLANALASCVNSSDLAGGTPSQACQNLFQAAGGTAANTLKAAFLAAASPVANVRGTAFYNLALPNTIFSPTLNAAPADWTVGGQQFAFAVNEQTQNLSAWRLSPLTGAMTPVTAGAAESCGGSSTATNCFGLSYDFSQGLQPKFVTTSPDGRFAFVAINCPASSAYCTAGTRFLGLSEFAIDPATGALVDSHDFSIAPNYAPGPAQGFALSPNGRFAYIVSGCKTNCTGADANSVTGWKITNPDTGTFTWIGNESFATGGTGSAAIGLSPNGRFAFIVNTCGSGTCGNGSSTLSAFSVDANTGALSLVGAPAALSASSNASGQGANGITLDPNGRFAYITDNAASTLTSYSYTAESADASPGQVQPHQSGLTLTKINSVGEFNDPTSVALTYTVTDTGTVTTGSIGCPGAVGGGSGSGNVPHIRVFFSRPVVHVTNGGGNTVTSVPVSDTGTLGTPTTTPAGTNPSDIATDTSGCNLYVTNGGGDDVSVYNTPPPGSGGTLTPASITDTFPAGLSPFGGAVDPSGRFVYAANYGDSSISAWQLDATTGMLAPVAGNACPGSTGRTNCFATDSGPNALAITPNGGYLYTPNDGSNNPSISGFALDSGTGGLAPVPNSPFPSGLGYSSLWLTISPDGRFAYATGSGLAEVGVFKIGADGQLSASSGASTGVAPQFVAEDPNGLYLYVGNEGGGISAYTIQQSGTAAGTLQFLQGGGAASCPDASPDPLNCFLPGRDVNGITVINTALGGTVLYAVSPSGSGHTASVISVWEVAPGTAQTPGALNALNGLPGAGSCDVGAGLNNCYAAGYFPEILTTDPGGHYLYASNQDNDSSIGTVSVWKINGDGSLTPVTGGGAGPCGVTDATDPDNCFAAGHNPYALFVDPSGRYLYVVNKGEPPAIGSVTAFAIAPAGSANPGALEPLSASAPPVSPPTGGTPTSIATSPPPPHAIAER